MVKRGGDNGWKILGLLLLGGVAFAYVQGGRGKHNSPLIPDALEDQMDLLVAAFNREFGHTWVDVGLDVLQAYIQGTMPGVATVVNAAYRAEQAYRYSPHAGGAKKQAAMRYVLRGG